MTAARARAYRRVVATLADLGPAKLLAEEQEQIREAADRLIFAGDLAGDEEAQEALFEIARLSRHLAESGRWERDRAARLADDVCGCGPALLPDLAAA
jgi:hypothetical protein